MTIPRVSPRRRAKRLSLSAKKKLHPEKYCAAPRCYRAPLHIGRCGTHATAHLDKLWSALVRKEECDAAEWHRKWLPCAGRIEACHKVRREYKRVRWNLANGFAGCHAVNYWMETHPLEADRMLWDWCGDEYDDLRRLALAPEKPDYDFALQQLFRFVT